MNLSSALRLSAGSVVTLTGAGGKTTTMVRLGQELAGQGLRVLATTTTRLGIDQLQLFPIFLVEPTPQEITAALADQRFVLVARGLDHSHDKVVGYPPEHIADFRPLADVVLVEGDGSRTLLLKAPGPGEPVVPASTTHLVCIANLGALGRPIGPEIIHRPERFVALTGARWGKPVTPALVARLLLHPDGPARGAPPGAERYFLLNGAAGAPDAAGALAERLAAAPGTTAVLLAEAAEASPVLASMGKVAAVVLAAGASTRFGSPKQLVPWQGQTLLRHVVVQTLAAPVQQVIVVLGAHFEDIAATLQGLPVEVVYNPDWEQGQSASVRAALAAFRPGTQAALFVLGDQPALLPGLFQRLVAAHRRTLAPIAAPRYQGRRGNPVLFDRGCFGELLTVQGDAGGRTLFARHAEQVSWIEGGPEILYDIDRPGDLPSNTAPGQLSPGS